MKPIGNIQIWLKRDAGKTRLEQSRSVRLLLQQACAHNDVELPGNFLSLPGPTLMAHIKNECDLSTSLSHCRGMAAIALGTGQLGLDCEQQGKERNWTGIARTFFTPAESRNISRRAKADQEATFLLHWVLKEAYIKATGGGLFGDLNKLSVSGTRSITVHRKASGDIRPWWAWQFDFMDCHFGVCSQQATEPTLQFFIIEANERAAYRDISDYITARPMRQAP
jgi:hypothetical protein